MNILGPNPTQKGYQTIGAEIKKALNAAPTSTIFRATVGYLSESGVNKLKPSLKRIIARGGTIEIIVGLNQVSTKSIRALTALNTICNGVGIFIFWNPDSNVTFHPKCYLISTRNGHLTNAWIGSSNFTKYGLFANYECNLHFAKDAINKQFMQQIENYYSKIRTSPYCYHLNPTRLRSLQKIKQLPRGERPTTNTSQVHSDIKRIFGRKKDVAPTGTFIMTLSKNDIDGKRWDPYFLIPTAAIARQRSFWHFPLRKGLNKQITAAITANNKQYRENRRIYYVDERQELRFVSPAIYKLGLAFLGAIAVIKWENGVYKIEVIQKHDPRFSGLLRRATRIASHQKRWGYT